MDPLLRHLALFQLRAPDRRHLDRRQLRRANNHHPPRVPHHLRRRLVHHLRQIRQYELIPALHKPQQLVELRPSRQRPPPPRVSQQYIDSRHPLVVVPPRQIGQLPGFQQRPRHAPRRLPVQQDRKHPAPPVPLHQQHTPLKLVRQRCRRMQRHRRCPAPRLRRQKRQNVAVRDRIRPVQPLVHRPHQFPRRKRLPQQSGDPRAFEGHLLHRRPVLQVPHRQRPQSLLRQLRRHIRHPLPVTEIQQ